MSMLAATILLAARAGAVGPERRRGVPGVRVRALRQPFPRLSFLQACSGSVVHTWVAKAHSLVR